MVVELGFFLFWIDLSSHQIWHDYKKFKLWFELENQPKTSMDQPWDKIPPSWAHSRAKVLAWPTKLASLSFELKLCKATHGGKLEVQIKPRGTNLDGLDDW